VKQVIEQMAESKYTEAYLQYCLTNDANDYSIYSSGTVANMIAMSQGTGVTQRIGDKITITSVQIKYTVNVWGAASGVGDLSGQTNSVFLCRLIIFSWKGLSYPTVANILSVATNDPTKPCSNVLAPLNHDMKRMRKIWYDQTTVHYDNGTTHTHMNTFKEIYIPITQFREVNYTQQAPIAYINGLYHLLVSNVVLGDEATGSGYPWPVYLYYRVNFKDI